MGGENNWVVGNASIKYCLGGWNNQEGKVR